MNKKSKSTLNKLEKILRFQKYSERTIQVYVSYASQFLSHFNKDLYHISLKEAETYLINKQYTSTSQQNQYISAVKHLYKKVAGRKLRSFVVQRPRKAKPLPKIIDADLLATKIRAIPNLKHRAILTLGLSAGLRVSEVVNLKWRHLDRRREVINIINSKGQKDRTCILNQSLIKLLESYYKEYRSTEYVFNGQNSKQYSATSIQKIVKKHIGQRATFHYLRHAYATYALDNGTELWALSQSMGHSSTKTTERYAHVSNKSLKTIKQAI